MEKLDLTQEEKDTLKVGIDELKYTIENSDIEKDKFLRNPFSYLRRKTNIVLLDYIAKSKILVEDFEAAVKYLFRTFKNLLNECLACKLSALLLIYGLLAKYGIAVVATIEFIDQFVNKLEEFFGSVAEDADQFIAELMKVNKQIKPSTIALNFCKAIGTCGNNSPRIVVITGDAVSRVN
ncbi:hypothetical protein [Flavobacterium poyangense]|uniref:hypothetical protein n=1 Tax=Flavobacterium poyangense TaxID=2204302 RepID=UPI0014215612|nr:hypothetical protein [Flavobacterium sp. JXAS1]